MCSEEIGMKKSQKSDAAEANVTQIDLGEKMDQVIRDEASKLAGRGPGGESRTSRFSGGYRPGMYGGYRPWYAGRAQGAGLGDWKLGSLMRLPDAIRSQGKELFTGALIGVAGNRVVAWVAPAIIKSSSKLATEAVAFGVTLLPYVFKQNVTTFGIALPGLFALLSTLTEEVIGYTKLLGPKPSLSGGQAPQMQQGAHADAVLAARRKLAEAQVRMQQRPSPAVRGPVAVARPRVVA
jgi:hypothetical protein